MYLDTVKMAARGSSDALPAAVAAPVVIAPHAQRAPEPAVREPVVEAHAVEHVKAAAAQIESYLRSNGRSLEFRVDGDTGRLVVTVRDPATGDTIRQIPSEEALALARSLGASGEATAALVNLSV